MKEKRVVVPGAAVPQIGAGYKMPMYFRCKFCYKYESLVSDLVMIYEAPDKKYFAHKNCVQAKQPPRYEAYKNQEQPEGGVCE